MQQDNYNVCRFIPYRNDGDKMNIIHYVLETTPQIFEKLKCIAVNQINLVIQGTGTFHTPTASYELQEGDLFFIMPSVPFAIESKEDFQYTYISYLGPRANAIMDKLKITTTNCIFHGFSHLKDLWLGGLSVNEAVSDLRSESILLYTFSALGDKLLGDISAAGKESETVLQVQKFIDDHISDTELSLSAIGAALGYNPKYISTIFKSAMRIGITDYITTLRIQQACALMNQGFTSIKNVAILCGFKDPLYFSKVFKTKMGLSPREYVRTN